MRIVEWLGVLATSLTIVGSAAAGGTWLADQRYVTHKDTIGQEIRNLKREVRKIQKKDARGQAADYEIDYLEDLKVEVEELEREYHAK